MRWSLTAITLACCLIGTQANAGWLSGSGSADAPHNRHAYQRTDNGFQGHHSGDAAYWLATRQGGPCGLVTERLVFGRSDHVLNGWNPWRAVEWALFQRAAPIPGMVVVWRSGRHVEVIAANNGDGTVATKGSVGFSRVSLQQVIVVDPHSARGRRYASR